MSGKVAVHSARPWGRRYKLDLACGHTVERAKRMTSVACDECKREARRRERARIVPRTK